MWMWILLFGIIICQENKHSLQVSSSSSIKWETMSDSEDEEVDDYVWHGGAFFMTTATSQVLRVWLGVAINFQQSGACGKYTGAAWDRDSLGLQQMCQLPNGRLEWMEPLPLFLWWYQWLELGEELIWPEARGKRNLASLSGSPILSPVPLGTGDNQCLNPPLGALCGFWSLTAALQDHA